MPKFPKKYSDKGFWDKLVSFAKSAGKEVIEKALWLYYAAQDPETPTLTKGMIYGTLGYFISPIDAIPDFIPGGYTDDLGILAVAVVSLTLYITEDIKAKAAKMM